MIVESFQQGDPEVRVNDVARSARSKAGVAWPLMAIVLLWSSCAHAEIQVFLLRGWFGVFSTGMDAMADELRAKGIKAEAIGHLAWKSTAARIAKARAAGQTGRLVLVGHSQGANNVIAMARELQAQNVSVDLLVTLVPFLQDPVPSNVARAINYYQSPGWGLPLTTDPDFKGKLSNVDISSDWGTFHVTIDKSPKIQSEVVGAIVELAR